MLFFAKLNLSSWSLELEVFDVFVNFLIKLCVLFFVFVVEEVKLSIVIVACEGSIYFKNGDLFTNLFLVDT